MNSLNDMVTNYIKVVDPSNIQQNITLSPQTMYTAPVIYNKESDCIMDTSCIPYRMIPAYSTVKGVKQFDNNNITIDNGRDTGSGIGTSDT
jgi:hypothetical protein